MSAGVAIIGVVGYQYFVKRVPSSLNPMDPSTSLSCGWRSLASFSPIELDSNRACSLGYHGRSRFLVDVPLWVGAWYRKPRNRCICQHYSCRVGCDPAWREVKPCQCDWYRALYSGRSIDQLSFMTPSKQSCGMGQVKERENHQIAR